MSTYITILGNIDSTFYETKSLKSIMKIMIFKIKFNFSMKKIWMNFINNYSYDWIYNEAIFKIKYFRVINM